MKITDTARRGFLLLTAALGKRIGFIDEDGNVIGTVQITAVRGNKTRLGLSFNTNITLTREGAPCPCPVCDGLQPHDLGE